MGLNVTRMIRVAVIVSSCNNPRGSPSVTIVQAASKSLHSRSRAGRPRSVGNVDDPSAHDGHVAHHNRDVPYATPAACTATGAVYARALMSRDLSMW